MSTEIEFIRKTIDDVTRNYAVDSARVVLYGYQAGAAMAYYVALTHRDVARGVVAVEAPLPARLSAPATEPTQPLAIYSVVAENSTVADRVRQSVKLLDQRAFPVLSKELPGTERDLNAAERGHMLRWIDVLDRM
jgi:poly(3-hydroxybutyrate) depolymerase